jgi:1-acyl-sn-glycerol-3-phosphate acyltransferase
MNSQLTNINSLCICKEYLCKYIEDLHTIVPCGHLIHERCIEKYITKKECPTCKRGIEEIISYTQIARMIVQKNYKYYQNYIDMTAVKNKSNYGNISYSKLLRQSLHNIITVSDLLTISSFKNAVSLSRHILDKYNIEVSMINKDKLLLNKSKVIIANHTSYLDSLIIFNKFKCGFLASSELNNIWYAKNISKHIPLVKLNRTNKETNTVDKMKEFLSKNKSLCLFPEGMITHPKTLIKFRTGAFNTGHPIQPIILNYDQFVYSEDYTKYLLKLLSQKNKIKVTVTVLDPVYPPFTAEKIEEVRHAMAKAGNFALSNVSNRDIRDTTN